MCWCRHRAGVRFATRVPQRVTQTTPEPRMRRGSVGAAGPGPQRRPPRQAAGPLTGAGCAQCSGRRRMLTATSVITVSGTTKLIITPE